MSQSAVVQRYISTSSAKKRKRQDVHCHFCGAEVDNRHLENHLGSNENCRMLYRGLLGIKSGHCIGDILILLFTCVNCFQTRRIILKKHLEENIPCCDKYKELLELDSIEEIIKYISNLKSRTGEGRSKVARHLQYERVKTKKQKLIDGKQT